MAKTPVRSKSKSAARKTSSKPSKRPRKTGTGSRVPEDNPRLRYQKLSADYFAGTPKNVSFARLRAAAVEDTRDMSPMNETPTTPATPGGTNWVQLGPLAIPNGQTYGGTRVVVTGRIAAVAAHPTDPDTIFVGAARGGIWKTPDGGVTWAPSSDNAVSLAIGALAISHSNPQTLYAGTGEGNIYFYRINYPLSSINESYSGSGILKTSDGGVTWNTQAASQFIGACFYRIAVHPTDPNTAFAASSLGLHRTTDGGITWVLLTNGLPAIGGSVIAATDLMFHPSTPATVFVAFWGSGIYKTTNGTAANPSWTKLAGGLPTTNVSRISMAISPTAPLRLYALIANASDGLNGFYASSDGGTTWSSIPAATGVVSVYGAYTSNVAVDISTPDVVYLSGVSLYKAVNTAGVWAVTDIGDKIHPDNHAFASHPTNHLAIYAGSDGGVYKSSDGGTTWQDTFNEGLCITQFEFIDQHPTSDAVIIGGTQDNGTEQFRNSPAFYHSADGDGGSAGIDHTTPRNVIHTYYGASPERSTQGGALGSWSNISTGLAGSSLFYPPMAFDQTNSQNVAFGTNGICLDSAQGTGGWPVKVALPGISGDVSAISYVNSNLIYACSTSGQVYRLSKSGATWTANAIHSAPLPSSYWIWAIATLPGDLNTIVVVFAGFGISHIWSGSVAAGGASATWTDISGTGANHVPDIPVNALSVDPSLPNTFYVGTDIGVFRTTDGGVNWLPFSDGLPNVAVYDLLLHDTTRLLRAATHGRGLWERKLDAVSMPNVDIYLRDHLLATGRILPTPSATATFDDPLQQVAIGDPLYWWMCADAKVDSPAATTHLYQMPVSAVDYLAFETRLAHTDPQRTATNRVYVQIHNRGIQSATNVTVKILYADATPGLPNLPPNFWTAFPGDGTITDWKPIGAAQTIPSISPTRPEILEWDWVPPATAAQHSCLLIVADCASDPIPPANKVFNIGQLVTVEKRVGLKNLHLINVLPAPFWSHLKISTSINPTDVLRVIGAPPGWSIGLLAPNAVNANLKTRGLMPGKLNKQQLVALQRDLQSMYKLYAPAKFQTVVPKAAGAEISGFPKSKEQFDLMLLFTPQKNATRRAVTIAVESEGKVIGGNTFVLSP
jgi:photosystem II stability/assembly factor-like uncharacterized protein